MYQPIIFQAFTLHNPTMWTRLKPIIIWYSLFLIFSFLVMEH
jgi:hypothetical protein